MADKVLLREGSTVVGVYDRGFYVGTVKVAQKGKLAGEERVGGQSWFGNGPRGLIHALSEAAGRIAEPETCSGLSEYVERLEKAVERLEGMVVSGEVKA